MFTVSEQIEYDRDGIKIVDGYRVDKDGRPVAFDLTALDARILCEGCAAHQDLGKTPAEIAASLADAQAEIARLRGALEKIADMTAYPAAYRSARAALDATQ